MLVSKLVRFRGRVGVQMLSPLLFQYEVVRCVGGRQGLAAMGNSIRLGGSPEPFQQSLFSAGVNRLVRALRSVGTQWEGSISADKFMGVPEFDRLLKMLEGLDSKEFIALLSAFSARVTKDDKLKCESVIQHEEEFSLLFQLNQSTLWVYDIDGNGKVRSSGMLQVLRDLSGNFLTDEQRQSVLTQALEQSGYMVDSAVTLQGFKKIFGKADLQMDVEVPVDQSTRCMIVLD